MGMMGEWMEVGAQLGIGVKLATNFPSNACWNSQDARQRLGDGECTRFIVPILGLTYII